MQILFIYLSSIMLFIIILVRAYLCMLLFIYLFMLLATKYLP